MNIDWIDKLTDEERSHIIRVAGGQEFICITVKGKNDEENKLSFELISEERRKHLTITQDIIIIIDDNYIYKVLPFKESTIADDLLQHIRRYIREKC